MAWFGFIFVPCFSKVSSKDYQSFNLKNLTMTVWQPFETLHKLCQHVHQLTCAEYFARRRPASQPLSQTLSCRACSSSRFKRIRDSLASFIFFSLSARRRSISFLRFRFASVASRSFSFLATRKNSNSYENEILEVSKKERYWHRKLHL